MNMSVSGIVASVLLAGGACFANSPSSIVGWGQNAHGETNPPAGLTCVTQFSAGSYHNLALQGDGSVVAWGWNNYGQCSVPPNLGSCTQVGAGSWHSLVLRSDGTVRAWGLNNQGQLDVPVSLSGVTQVHGGASHSLAVKTDGTVVCWGGNQWGQSSVPVGLTDVVQAVTHLSWHNTALRTNGSVVCWGQNLNGQIDVPTDLPRAVQVAGGEQHSLALLTDGTVRAWGISANGISTPPAGLSNVVAIVGGGFHSVALQANGAVVCWGSGQAGGTGDHQFGQCVVPNNLGGVSQIGAGYQHTLAMVGPATTVSGVQPISGPTEGGTQLAIIGTGFTPDAAVTIGGVPASNVIYISPNRLTAITPPGVPGITSVKVNCASTDAFYYRPYCGSDLDQNGSVDGGDMSILLLDWGTCYSSVQASQSQDPPGLLADEPAQKPVQR